MKLLKGSSIGLCLIALLVVASVRADTAFVATKDGDVSVQCMCVANAAGCGRKFFDSVAGGERPSWTQRAHVIAGHTYNLDELCYRKRAVPGFGSGLCCEAADDKSPISRLFRGTVSQ
jgi:hypothetical protein